MLSFIKKIFNWNTIANYQKSPNELMDKNIDFSSITRFEVIDKNGRAVVYYNVKVEPSVQDEGRTLKIFITE